MIIRKLILTSLLWAATVSVFAHGPTPQKVIESITIAAGPPEVWERLQTFDDIAAWHPLVTSSIGDGKNKPGKSERTLTLKKGGQIVEGLDDLDPDQLRLQYRLSKENVDALPVSSYSAILTVKPIGDGSSQVEWKSRLYRGDTSNFPPPELNDEKAVEAMKHFFTSGLKGLKESIENSQ